MEESSHTSQMDADRSLPNGPSLVSNKNNTVQHHPTATIIEPSDENGKTAAQSSRDRSSSGPPRDSKGWDGKLRVGKGLQPLDGHPGSRAEDEDGDDDDDDEEDEADTDEEHEREGKTTSTEAQSVVARQNQGDSIAANMPPGFQLVEVNGEEINADEDLLEGVPEDETDIDLNHSRIKSIPALRLDRFKKIERLCLRQNEILSINLPSDWESSKTITDLDLYDNLISHVKGLDELTELTTLDLSYNKIKHVKRVSHLKKLKELYFVQNKISSICGLEGLTQLKSLELGGNKIRKIENLETLTALTELWLGKNKISRFENLSALTSLTTISIQSNRLTSESLSHLSTLPALTDLYMSHNAITSIAPLAACTRLTLLDVSNNPISSLAGLEPLAELEEVWASNCRLESFDEMEKVLGDKRSLETVYFEGNPLETRQRVLYRNKVRLALPRVRQIDATFVRVE